MYHKGEMMRWCLLLALLITGCSRSPADPHTFGSEWLIHAASDDHVIGIDGNDFLEIPNGTKVRIAGTVMTGEGSTKYRVLVLDGQYTGRTVQVWRDTLVPVTSG